LLDRGMERRASYDFLAAYEALDRLVAYCPDYAEGYNQRAFVSFLRQDFAAALADLDRALALSPDHVAALSGRALTLLGLGRTEEARLALSRALALNPWLPERGLAAPGGPLAPRGEDL
jgi:tetratricopeptide (TPR) repeat protein